MRRATKALVLAAGIALVPAASASGHAFYVAVGGPGGDCLSPEQACPTIGQALAMTDDVVLVAPGTYTENVTVDPGKFLIAMGTPTATSHVIQPADPANPAVTVTGTSADPALALGFAIKGPEPVVLNGAGRISGNFFSNSTVGDDDPYVLVQGSGASLVEGNSFDSDGTDREIGIETTAGGSPLIANNTLSDLWRGIDARAGTPTLRGNVIQGTHNDPGGEGAAIHVAGASATLSGNTVRAPSTASGSPAGVRVDGAGASTVGTLLRNRVLDHDPGVGVTGPNATASLSSDLIAGGDNGIHATNTSVSATNLTAFDAATTDVALQDASLSLNSSVVEHPIAAAGASTCAIGFSAGPTTGSGCDGFQQSSSAPGFVDPASGNYELTAGSTLLDAGDPSPPPAGGQDLAGDPRAAAATCGAPERRDIGADELVLTCPSPPPSDPPTGPGPTPLPRDSDPPDTKIDKAKIRGRRALFRFSADEAGSSFLCKLDKHGFRACKSPKRYSGLDDGSHVFRVRAVDAAGNEEADSARRRFRIGG